MTKVLLALLMTFLSSLLQSQSLTVPSSEADTKKSEVVTISLTFPLWSKKLPISIPLGLKTVVCCCDPEAEDEDEEDDDPDPDEEEAADNDEKLSPLVRPAGDPSDLPPWVSLDWVPEREEPAPEEEEEERL